MGAATAVFTVLIALLGAAMMTVSMNPLGKGGALMWLPAALQLIAGVWLGPIRGLIAGAIGAQAAGVIAYSGWAPADWIMNLVAGGLANSWLPALMFRWLRIDPSFGSKSKSLWRSAGILLFLVVFVSILGVGQLYLGPEISMNGGLGYILPLIVLLIVPLFWRSMRLSMRDFLLGVFVAIVTCLISAAIGTWGTFVGGESWEAAFHKAGIGWFLGDFTSAVLGIYVLAQFTPLARQVGIAPHFIR